MNRTALSPRLSLTAASRTAGIVSALASLSLVAGCSVGEKPFAKVNGAVITQAEYIKALERQQVAVPGGQPTNAERLVIDQLIGNKIILTEATKASVLPTDDDVNRYYNLQKQLFEQQVPGKNYETTMKEQGTAPEEVKNDMKVQLAETALYAKKLGITDAEVRKAFESARGQIGLPARVQLRMILTAPNSPDFQQAKQLLASGKDFNEVAKQVNPPQLKATGGLVPQATPVQSIAAKYQSQVQQLAEGKFFGPIDFQLAAGQPMQQAWVKVEKKLPAFTVPFEDAAPLVRRQLVQQKIMSPENAKVRDEIMGLKLKAAFEPTDTNYSNVWGAIKKTAEDAGVGKMATGTAVPPIGAPSGAATAIKP